MEEKIMIYSCKPIMSEVWEYSIISAEGVKFLLGIDITHGIIAAEVKVLTRWIWGVDNDIPYWWLHQYLEKPFLREGPVKEEAKKYLLQLSEEDIRILTRWSCSTTKP